MTPVSRQPLVSIVLLNYNGRPWMHRCLESIQAQTLFARVELLVADNASTDGSDALAEELIKGWPNAVFIQNGANIGFGAGSNLAVQRAKGKYLFFLNPDVWLEADCLEQLYSVTEKTAAGAAGLLVMDYDDDNVQSRGGSAYDISGYSVIPSRGVIPRILFAACGFYFIRTELFRKIGGFDPEFFLYGEEVDLSWRVWITGETILHVPQSRMHHRGAALANPKGGTKIIENRTSEAKRFYANRNHLITLCKDCQAFLLLLILPCLVLLLLEGIVGIVLLRRLSFFTESFSHPLADCWRLRHHIRAERRKIAVFRKRSDFYMLRFLTWRLSRWQEVLRMLKLGLPIVEPRKAASQNPPA